MLEYNTEENSGMSSIAGQCKPMMSRRHIDDCGAAYAITCRLTDAIALDSGTVYSARESSRNRVLPCGGFGDCRTGGMGIFTCDARARVLQLS